jgi:hypothetical protein
MGGRISPSPGSRLSTQSQKKMVASSLSPPPPPPLLSSQVLGASFPDKFGPSLKNGNILCQLLNTIKPVCVSANKSKLAFLHMENVSNYLYMYIYMYIMCANKYIYIYIYICIYIFIYTCVYIYMHSYLHACMMYVVHVYTHVHRGGTRFCERYKEKFISHAGLRKNT